MTNGNEIQSQELKLTAKEERFCYEYVLHLNATKAAINAEYSEKTARQIGARLLTKVNIQNRIEYLKANLAETAEISALRVIKEHEKIAFANSGQLRDGWMSLKDYEQLTEDQKSIIQEVTTKKFDFEVNYFKIEFYPPAGPKDNEPNAPDNLILPEGVKSNVGNTQPNKPPNKGAIKSIEGYTIKAKSEESGINESQENSTVNRNEEKNEDINKQVDIKEQPAADPYRWHYILGIVIVIALSAIGVYFAFRKSKFVSSIISFLKAFFVS